jgi:aldehyde dehydrogenase (NAD+)
MHYSHFYIDGGWQAPAGTERLVVHSASTEAPIGSVPLATPQDVDRAATAARRAFEAGWARTPAAERADWLSRLATALEARVPAIARTIAMEVGSPITMASRIQAQSPVTIVSSFASLARDYPYATSIGRTRVLREAYGVVGAITPWNYPLYQIVTKVAAALAAGCTVVVKPSELAPLNAYALADACEHIGLPPGVVNIVCGTGPDVGEALATHPQVDVVSFTGSVRAGRRVAARAGGELKKVTLELGGKSACVVLDDAPLDKAIPHGVRNALLNSGQTCSAWTRLIVPRARLADVLDLARATVTSLPLGDPLDPATRLGPLISRAQRERVEAYIEQGRREGAQLVLGGGRPERFASGHYVEPTIFANVTTTMTIAQEEIFGPVIVVLTYDTDDDAVRMANDTVYGLAGAVWSADLQRALEIAARIRAGQVDVNGARFNPLAPFGGFKQSGLGRELGVFGLEEFLQVKAVTCDTPP